MSAPTLRALLHWRLRHRKPFRSCAVHCGCDCADGPCHHSEFRLLEGRCAHCGRDDKNSGGSPSNDSREADEQLNTGSASGASSDRDDSPRGWVGRPSHATGDAR